MFIRTVFSFLLFFTGMYRLSAQTTVSDSIVSGGIQRVYKLYIPTLYNNTTSLRPLILNMHGYTSNASQQQTYTNFMPIADTANFLMVYPEGTFLPGTSNTYWNADFYSTGVNDVLFLSDLIDTLSAHYRIDPNRIYATGFSNGGFMSYTLACELSNKIAAIASVSGTMSDTQFGVSGSSCHPSRPVPVMHIHGDADGTVPYNGGNILGINIMAVDSVLHFWTAYNQCNPIPTITSVPDINTFDNCTAVHYVYDGGSSGTTVELFKIISGGHTWPGSFPINWWEATNQDINASKEIWRFFSSYQLGSTTSVNSNLHSDSELQLFPNPASNALYVKAEKTKTIVLVNLAGQVLSTHLIQNSAVIPIAHLNSGIYFVKDMSDGKCLKLVKE